MVQKEVCKAEEESCQACSHEQAGQLDEVGERAREDTDLAGHLKNGRTLDQISVVFRV